MSGKYPARSGCTNFGHHMDPSEVTLAETLKESGYATYIGETNDLAKSRPGLTQELQAQLDAWQKSGTARPFQGKKKEKK